MAFYDSATLEAAIETFFYTGHNPLHVKECLLKEIHDDAAKPQKEKVLAVLEKQFIARGEPCDDEISFKDDESGKTWLYTSSFDFLLFKNAASLLEMIDPPKGSLGDYVNLLLGLRTAVLRSGQLWGFETDTLLGYATMTDAQRRQIILGFVDYAEYHQREKNGNQAMNGVLSVGDYLDKTHHEAVFEIIRSIIGKGHCGVADLVNLRNCVLGAQTLHITPPQLNRNSWKYQEKRVEARSIHLRTEVLQTPDDRASFASRSPFSKTPRAPKTPKNEAPIRRSSRFPMTIKAEVPEKPNGGAAMRKATKRQRRE